MATCVPCPRGKYANRDGMTVELYERFPEKFACQPCPAGTFGDAEGASMCTLCPEGTFSLLGSMACEECLPGKLPNTDRKSCSACPAGTYWAMRPYQVEKADGSKKWLEKPGCQECPHGSFQNKAGMLYCEPCGRSQTTLLPGARALESCIHSQESAPFEEWELYDNTKRVSYEGDIAKDRAYDSSSGSSSASSSSQTSWTGDQTPEQLSSTLAGGGGGSTGTTGATEASNAPPSIPSSSGGTENSGGAFLGGESSSSVREKLSGALLGFLVFFAFTHIL
uniref:Tyrosine-protein kinase ephrin type A/B receptor-like domain-containing protein n=1 Tax=Chromera velia CCMP2878 TaxID=1169474 RepID=A0A0G4GF64_9ALVE|eukprot:Cvel_21609.t1-p1 / transcript=Cvel_21609.t1 / gene=Cvel_21609 / organism=Chromera_velia_CCMP2878 / gene_product=Signal peptide, CUB and EGF-like domain-containing, putative / transcript_product=Signal peptide, CUB and EGF-like domain-containing, putative / location=Cvel_scaffold2041:8489-9947(-) / protein_length=279 / sequence_SO=supercontig / SO=protein_coding / is_pseudo=false